MFTYDSGKLDPIAAQLARSIGATFSGSRESLMKHHKLNYREYMACVCKGSLVNGADAIAAAINAGVPGRQELLARLATVVNEWLAEQGPENPGKPEDN